MTHVVIVFALTVAVTALMCGHQGEDFPPVVTRALRAVRRRLTNHRSNT